MTDHDSVRRSGCPITYALDLLGDKWSLLIIRDILLKGKRRYQEFADSEERIASNILASRLARLEAEGFLTKRRDPENGRQYLYGVTDKTLDLLPMLVELVLWSVKYDAGTSADPKLIQRIKQDKGAFIALITERYFAADGGTVRDPSTTTQRKQRKSNESAKAKKSRT